MVNFSHKKQIEKCTIGGGAGMAPMRSHIYDQLKRIKNKKDRRDTFWYGGRSEKENYSILMNSENLKNNFLTLLYMCFK